MDNVGRMLTSIVVEDAKKGPMELRFSHIVSTPRGNYAVFCAHDEDMTTRIFKLSEVDEGEEMYVCHCWANISRALGKNEFVFLKPKE